MFKDWIGLLRSDPQSQDREITLDEINDVEWEMEMAENRAKLAEMVQPQKAYLLERGKCIMTNSAVYRMSAATDIKATMREYVEAELPMMKEAYKFLYVVNA